MTRLERLQITSTTHDAFKVRNYRGSRYSFVYALVGHTSSKERIVRMKSLKKLKAHLDWEDARD